MSETTVVKNLENRPNGDPVFDPNLQITVIEVGISD